LIVAEHASLARALTTGVLVGLMADMPGVNMINADTIAAENGFKVRRRRGAPSLSGR